MTVPNGLSFVRVRSGNNPSSSASAIPSERTPLIGGSFGRAGWRPMPSSRTGFGSFGKQKEAHDRAGRPPASGGPFP